VGLYFSPVLSGVGGVACIWFLFSLVSSSAMPSVLFVLVPLVPFL
jgi:hypothetical protein